MSVVDQSNLAKLNKPSFIERFIRNRLIRKLQDLPVGRLTIVLPGERLVFGRVSKTCAQTGVIEIKDESALYDIALGGSMGAGESYMQGKWASPDLVGLVRLISMNIEFINNFEQSGFSFKRVYDKAYHLLNRNSLTGSTQNISRHYDLGNEFFSVFLDPLMMYSSAIYSNKTSSLAEAAEHKLRVVCAKLELKAEDHLLEIGSGWGGMAIYAAKNYGCRVTTTTISKEQYKSTCKRVRDAGLENQVNVLCEDYRSLEGRYEKLVSIEMIEAVGHQYYKQYFATCSSLLKPGGLMLLQSITIPGQRYKHALTSVDFIQRYIFPGGSLPSHEVISICVAKHTDMQMIGMQEIGLDYAKTLRDWRSRFMSRLDEVKKQGFDDVFIRMWEFYLCYCQGAFEEKVIGTAHLLFEKPAVLEHAKTTNCKQ